MSKSVYYQGGTLVLRDVDARERPPAPFKLIRERWRYEGYHYGSLQPYLQEQAVRDTVPRWQPLNLRMQETREPHDYQVLQAVGALYRFLVRRGALASSLVVYVDVPKSKWLVEHNLLAYTRKGQAALSVQRMELKLKEPDRIPLTVSEKDFKAFVDSIHMGEEPNGDPSDRR